MNTIAVAAIAFACSIGGASLGVALRAILPESHRDDDSKEMLKIGTGLIGTMVALVLGLLVASATSAFNAEEEGFQRLATDFVVLDRALKHFGPEAKVARDRLRHTVAATIARLGDGRLKASRSSGFDAAEITSAGDDLADAIRALSPRDDFQRIILSRAIQLGGELAKTRLDLIQGEDGAIPTPFLVILMFWLAVLFVGFGLLSPRNATVFLVNLVCALSTAAAVFLILDLNRPFDGLIRVPDDSLRDALSRLGR